MLLYIADVRDFCSEEGIYLLSEERRNKALRYQSCLDRARSIAGGLLLRFHYGLYSHSLSHGPYGKPYIDSEADCLMPFFSLSHSGDYAMLLCADNECGADIERIVANRNFKALSRRLASPDEHEWLERKCFDLDCFYRLWAAKESAIKASGKGLAAPTKAFSMLPLENGPYEAMGKKYYVSWFSVPGYAACIAVEGSQPCGEVRPIMLSKRDLLY
ncbi:MAG: 4'-phosphopantetheinyl transferase superfamily protein [Eubacteriaceae bacterium]|jgi:4'-phosphopantetheinyl transferase|nr:4'-phosphopantetheinyl transferase superfamily protein [Eubacteriaceae bacterium]